MATHYPQDSHISEQVQDLMLQDTVYTLILCVPFASGAASSCPLQLERGEKSISDARCNCNYTCTSLVPEPKQGFIPVLDSDYGILSGVL